MDNKNLVSKLNQAAKKINNAGVYGSGNFLVTDADVGRKIYALRRRQRRIEKLKDILDE